MFFLVVLLSLAEVTFSNNVFEKNSLRSKLPLEALTTHPNKSMLVSTLALRFAFCKFATVANSETQKDLLLALGIDNVSKAKFCYENIQIPLLEFRNADFISLNKIYVSYTDSIDANFTTNSSEEFGVQVDKVGFNYPTYATAFINKWMDMASYKRLINIIGPNDITRDTSIIHVSGYYLKTTWEMPFDIRFTKDLRFYHFGGKISFIPMMSRTESFMYFHDKTNNLEILNIKMGPGGTSITFILPQYHRDLPTILKKINEGPIFLKNIKDLMRYTVIRITLPRFKIKTTFDWTELIQKFVSKQIFNTTSSGLDGMLKKDGKTKNVYLSKVKQNNFMILDEMGVVRFIKALRMPHAPITEPPHNPRQQDFIANRPFYFTVDFEQRDGDSHELFHGVFYGPE